jgi:hypothetical protein
MTSARVTACALLVCLGIPSSAGAQSGAQQTVDWSQPPVACVEEIVPALPTKKCLDLSQLKDPIKDLPHNLHLADLAFWMGHPKFFGYCRALEVMRREEVVPGSQSASRVETSWMQKIAVVNRDEKINAVYQASLLQQIPAQVLAGALYQESMFSELGIAEDGGNYSCGVGQVNLTEWCHWANEQPTIEKDKLGWPQGSIDCSQLTPDLIHPFYAIALTRLSGLPEYRLEKEHFRTISISDVAENFPPASEEAQALRFLASRSFIDHCSESTSGIAAKAHELRSLYSNFVPDGLKQIGNYSGGESFHRACGDHGYESAYPLNLGWLMAVGMYNAGPRAMDALAYYNGWSVDDMRKPETFSNLTVPEIVSSLYWAGDYQAIDDKIHFLRLNGAPTSWPWMKACVLQRHIARVVQNVTLAGAPVLADTLEGVYHCAKSIFDPITGTLIHSAVPPERQISSGRK